MSIRSDYSHTIAGLFCFDLPLGILLAFIFQNIVRNSLFDNLPYPLKARLAIFKRFDWNTYFRKNWLVVITSILIGAASHILWDSFTHESGYFVRMFAELSHTRDIFGRQIPVSKILQHSSTLLGGLAISYAIYKLSPDRTVDKTIKLSYWIILAGLSLTIISIRVLSGLDLNNYGNLIVTAISAGLLSLVLTPIALNKK